MLEWKFKRILIVKYAQSLGKTRQLVFFFYLRVKPPAMLGANDTYRYECNIKIKTILVIMKLSLSAWKILWNIKEKKFIIIWEKKWEGYLDN